MAPDERVRFLGHVRLTSTAWSFLESAVKDGDLRAAWAVVDPVLRLCLAQQWLLDNAVDLDAHGFNREEVAEAFVEDEPNHELWPHFERVHVRSLRQVVPSPDVWGMGANTRLIAPDVELLYVHDACDMTDGTWQPDEAREVYPLLMRLGWHALACPQPRFGCDPAPGLASHLGLTMWRRPEGWVQPSMPWLLRSVAHCPETAND